MQGDGNFVVYENGNAIWHTDTAGDGRRRLIMNADGDLKVLLFADSTLQDFQGAVWQSGAHLDQVTVAKGQFFLKMLDTGALAVYVGNSGKTLKQLWINDPRRAPVDPTTIPERPSLPSDTNPAPAKDPNNRGECLVRGWMAWRR